MISRSVLEYALATESAAAALRTHAAGEGAAAPGATNVIGLELQGTRALGVRVDGGRERVVESPPMHVTWTPAHVRTHWRPTTSVRVLTVAIPDALLLMAASTLRGRDPDALVAGPLREPLAAADLPDVARRTAGLAAVLSGDIATQRLALEAASHAIALSMVQARAGRPLESATAVRELTVAQRRRALEYIDTRVGETVALSDIASAACVSPFHFARAFRRTFGRSPWQYVLAVRLERARHVVERSTRTLSTIALDHGFAHLSHFTTAFRRAYGISPVEWRIRARS